MCGIYSDYTTERAYPGHDPGHVEDGSDATRVKLYYKVQLGQ